MKKVVSLFIISILLFSILILLNSVNVSAVTCGSECISQLPSSGCPDVCTGSGSAVCPCSMTEEGKCYPTNA
ncbi:MAG: hypothetical protein ABH817_01730, partial [archaeon]